MNIHLYRLTKYLCYPWTEEKFRWPHLFWSQANYDTLIIWKHIWRTFLLGPGSWNQIDVRLISCAYYRKNESKKISNCTLRHFFEIKPSDILYFRDFVRTTSDNWLSVKEYVHHDCIFSYGSENFSIRIHACTHPWSLPGAGGRKRTPVTFARSRYVALYFVHNK